MVQCDFHVMLRHDSEQLGISLERVHHIVTQVLEHQKVCTLWVPKSLNDHQKATHVGICFKHLLWYEKEGDEFLDRIVAGDESWCLHYDPETKCMSQQWKHSLSPRPKKSRVIPSTGKVMLTLFFDCHRPLLIDWLPKGSTINANCYGETLDHWRRAIKELRQMIQR